MTFKYYSVSFQKIEKFFLFIQLILLKAALLENSTFDGFFASYMQLFFDHVTKYYSYKHKNRLKVLQLQNIAQKLVQAKDNTTKLWCN